MINKGLKNKVLLSVFATLIAFNNVALASEINFEDVNVNTNGWKDEIESQQEVKLEQCKNYSSLGGTYRASDANDYLIIKNFAGDKDKSEHAFYNVSLIENSTLQSVNGGVPDEKNLTSDSVTGKKITVSKCDMVYASAANQKGQEFDVVGNEISITNGSEITSVWGGLVQYVDEPSVINNTAIIDNSKVNTVFGGQSENIDGSAIGNKVIIQNNAEIYEAAVCNSTYTEAKDGLMKIIGNNKLENAQLYGWYAANHAEIKHSNNTLSLDNFNGNISEIGNFEHISFENLNFDKNGVVTAKTAIGLDGTDVQISSFAGGQNLEVGKTVYLLRIENKYSWDESFTNLNKQTTTNAGVAAVVTSDIAKDEANQTITATIKDVKIADQTKLVAENRAVAAAFVNQGTDLIADSLDTLSRDGKYGVKTFAAVHGNRSKYDVNSDIKINGWSTIVGVGAENEHNGGDFSWGVFYENGSGNYRTYNDFNNEFFRGDGSLVYNGGGIAARYENSHGVYTEGSLRAGMLKSEMTDALSDGENKYGYESETAYYGAHIGVGKVFSLGDDSDLDVYGKFFHTYTEGDSFNVAGDEFEFDSINSDRLRIGARVTSNKENKFSTYYGLAYEYEFNGDAEMRAAGMKAPTQSLQGSSVMAEIGLNYQPTPDSPWSFDLNMRGYAGERQGGSFNVQATYTF